ncbi:LuxR C-terminal-related transcriptional regulator [Cellulomonas fimi]|uniref:LuxR C-terminal-related transcriptional regulator n=1 Tax=Cellulomonas fimi TaxID=1708 RepID=UPI00234D8B02|nr:LuxR C-terminal-related transcriptional regulator [Cellulomonas fimi]MDC7121429.1 LuxR C-terminal-related transcriptional regulator [Cellulomonas fimi]
MSVRHVAHGTAPGVKVSTPPLGVHVVPRPGPTAELEAAVVGHRVAAVVAPAGFGKTTLVASWAAHTGLPVAWLTLDASDDDPVRLVRGLEAAVAVALSEEERTALRRAAAGADRGARGRLDALLVGLGERTTPLVLVVDDVHEVHGPTGRDVLSRLVRYAPPTLRLVLVARADPGVPLHRLRVDGELGEVRAVSLALGADEVVRVAAAAGVRLDRAGGERLRELTDGWAVAVRMMLLGLATGPDTARRLGTAPPTTVPVADYVVDEVLAGLPPALGAFVLLATVDDVVDPGLAEVLVPGGAALLDECVARGLFLTPAASPDAPAYRWHGLFAAQCRVLLSRRDPAALAGAHRTVATHRRDTDWPGAVRHACAAGDGALAVDVLRAHWPEVLVAGDTTLLRRLCALVVAQGRRDAWLLLAQAAADLLDGHGDPTVFPQIRRAVAAWGPDDDLLAQVLTSALGSPVGPDGVPHGTHDGPTVDLDREDVAPPTRALALYLLGRTEAHEGLDPGAAAAHLAHGAAAADAVGLPTVACACRAERALLLADAGELAVADALAVDLLAGDGVRTGALAPAHLVRGLVAYWQDRLDDARADLDDALTLAGPAQLAVAVRAAATLALVCHAQDDRTGFEQARRRVEVALRTSDSGGARHAAPADGPDAEQHVSLDVLGRIATSHCRTSVDVVAVLQRALAVAEADEHTAHRLLERALDVADPAGVRRPFVELEPLLHDLLLEHLRWGSTHEAMVASLVAGDVPRRAQRGGWGNLDLTEREHQVLVRLRSTMTTTEIAAALFVSTNTVKTHQRSIYRKLGVAGRRDAIRVAAERGLF